MFQWANPFICCIIVSVSCCLYYPTGFVLMCSTIIIVWYVLIYNLYWYIYIVIYFKHVSLPKMSCLYTILIAYVFVISDFLLLAVVAIVELCCSLLLYSFLVWFLIHFDKSISSTICWPFALTCYCCCFLIFGSLL